MMSKKLVSGIVFLFMSNLAFGAPATKPMCDNSSLFGDYNAQIFGVKDGKSIAGHYKFTFDGQTDPITQAGTFRSEAFDSFFTDGIKIDNGFKNSKKGNLYRVYDEGCWTTITLSPTEKKEDQFSISVDLSHMSILKKPYTANYAVGAFVRNGVGYTFTMTRWIQVK